MDTHTLQPLSLHKEGGAKVVVMVVGDRLNKLFIFWLSFFFFFGNQTCSFVRYLSFFPILPSICGHTEMRLPLLQRPCLSHPVFLGFGQVQTAGRLGVYSTLLLSSILTLLRADKKIKQT